MSHFTLERAGNKAIFLAGQLYRDAEQALGKENLQSNMLRATPWTVGAIAATVATTIVIATGILAGGWAIGLALGVAALVGLMVFKVSYTLFPAALTTKQKVQRLVQEMDLLKDTDALKNIAVRVDIPTTKASFQAAKTAYPKKTPVSTALNSALHAAISLKQGEQDKTKQAVYQRIQAFNYAAGIAGEADLTRQIDIHNSYTEINNKDPFQDALTIVRAIIMAQKGAAAAATLTTEFE